MADLKSHIDKAQHNINAMSHLFQDPRFGDWIVVTAFYASLHIIEAILFHKNDSPYNHSRSHKDRGDKIKGNKRLSKIYSYYSELKRESNIARYISGHNPDNPIVDFKTRMPNKILKGFLRSNLGGLLKSAEKFLPKDEHKKLTEEFNEKLKSHLDLT